MPAEHAEPEHPDPLTVLGQVDPPAPRVLENAREALWAVVAAEMLAGDAPGQTAAHAPGQTAAHTPGQTGRAPQQTACRAPGQAEGHMPRQAEADS
jgi:hypothetical protein